MPYKSGGTGVVSSHTMEPRVISIGNDKRCLGRWAWIWLQGKDKAVTIMLAYRPYIPSLSGVQIVYEQNSRTLPIQCDLRI